MREKEKEKINVRNLNRCIREYRKLGKLLNTFIIFVMVALAIYLLNKLNVFPFIESFFRLLLPLFIGLIVAWAMSPFIDKLSKKIPRVAACIVAYVILFGLISFLFSLILPNFINQIKDLVSTLPDILDELKEIIVRVIGDDNGASDNIFKMIDSMTNNFIETLPDKLIVGTRSFISTMTTLLLGIMISFYLSYDYHKMTKSAYKLVPEKYRKDTKDLVRRINHTLRNYIEGVLIVMFLVFISQAVGLSISGLKAPLIFALFCAITDIIPYFGPWIGAVPAMIVALTISPTTALFTLASIIIVQALENNFYQPLIMGHTMKLHPVTIMLGLLIFGHFFGIIGMIIATPVVATIKIVLVFVDEKLDIVERINEYIMQND